MASSSLCCCCCWISSSSSSSTTKFLTPIIIPNGIGPRNNNNNNNKRNITTFLSSSSPSLIYPPPPPPLISFSLSKNRIFCLAKSREDEDDAQSKKEEEGDEEEAATTPAAAAPKDYVTIAACLVGLLTGLGVVLFNTAVHEIRDLFWDGLPSRGASWLREEPLEVVWQRVILVPVCGGVIVSMLNSLQSHLKSPSKDIVESNVKDALRPFLKAVAASVTLGTGNSLGPEGPSVEIGSAIAKGVGHVFQWKGGRRLSLIASGSAAGISSGFNAAVAGCFFAVESVLWPSPTDSSSQLTNSTPMVILSSVIASVVSEVGLGSDPAFSVPEYDFRSPGELPLYLLLGVLCGVVSLTLSWCTSYALKLVDNFHKATGITKAVFPVLGGLTVGLIALSYPEVLYWGFENVDILLESRPFVNSLPASILIQLVGVKIIATSLSRASGLVGGYYAPSLFIGAATGMAYGKLMGSTFVGPNPLFHFSILEVASPQAYGLVDKILVSDICQLEGNKCQIWTATPDMTVLTAERIMDSHGVNQLPVVSEHTDNHARGNLIGLLDRECISIVCRAVATKESLSPSSMMRKQESSP